MTILFDYNIVSGLREQFYYMNSCQCTIITNNDKTCYEVKIEGETAPKLKKKSSTIGI